jgi:hypothetical protein
MSLRHTPICLFVSVFLVACGSSDRGPAAIGRAFVGPATLNIRDELAPGSKVVGTVKHGDELQILQTRRRFVQVRTPEGAIGWTDSRVLMTPQQMDELKALADRSASLPSQGAATVFEVLNVHTEPSRPSPSFAQITEGMTVDIVGYSVTPRTSTAPRRELVPKKPAPTPVRKKKRRSRTPAAWRSRRCPARPSHRRTGWICRTASLLRPIPEPAPAPPNRFRWTTGAWSG